VTVLSRAHSVRAKPFCQNAAQKAMTMAKITSRPMIRERASATACSDLSAGVRSLLREPMAEADENDQGGHHSRLAERKATVQP
jgi:hypothetical protein